VSILDGLNEIPPNEQSLLLNRLKNVGIETGRSYVVTTARLGIREQFVGFILASVESLDPVSVRDAYDDRFSENGISAFDRLDARMRRILRRPFFLALSLRGQKLEGLHNWSGIFNRFFEERVGVSPDRLLAIAQAAFESLDDVGGIKIDDFRAKVGSRLYTALVEAEIISRGEGGFDHELWRDFLASYYLSVNPQLWNNENFNRVTVRASSFECLPLTMQQIGSSVLRSQFVTAVYDWNLGASVECLEYAVGDAAGEGELIPGLEAAILAAIADKQFDRVENSRRTASRQLLEHEGNLAVAGRFRGLATRPLLVESALSLGIDGDWYDRWSSIFRLDDGEDAPDDLIEMVADTDAVIGWTATNTLRRLKITNEQLKRLCDIYNENNTSETRQVVRWRVIHALGAHPDLQGADLLEKALSGDTYAWVRYGAARSLVESAALSQGTLRASAVEGLKRAIPSLQSIARADRRRILIEILEATFVKGAAADWLAQAVDIASFIQQYADKDYEHDLKVRALELTSTAEWR
jgi:hypothetical protein